MRNSNVRSHQEEFLKPLRQVLPYCIKVNSRYGYIITDTERFFFCRTKSEEPARPLSTNRPHREHTQPIHNRVASITSVTSATSAISLDFSGSQYTYARNLDVNEGPLEYSVAPWGSSGSDFLTINLSLWFIHLLTASNNSVKEWFQVLGTWQTVTDQNGRDQYQKVDSNRTEAKLPQGVKLVDSHLAISAGPSGVVSATSSETSAAGSATSTAKKAEGSKGRQQ